VKIFVTDFDGTEHELEALEGWRIMEIIRDWGIGIKAECGGACACSTCHVYIAPEWIGRIPSATSEEDDQLDLALGVEPNSRLSCQILMRPELDGLRLTLAPGSETEEKQSSRVA
jgi:2Fe-2S ferredoxin